MKIPKHISIEFNEKKFFNKTELSLNEQITKKNLITIFLYLFIIIIITLLFRTKIEFEIYIIIYYSKSEIIILKEEYLPLEIDFLTFFGILMASNCYVTLLFL